VRLRELSGLQAICVLLAQPDASFNFNPLIKASQRTIDPEFQRVVSDLFGCWDESAIQIESTPEVRPAALESPEDVSTPTPAIQGRIKEALALPPAPALVQQRSVFMVAAAVLIIVAISTVIAVTGRLGRIQSASAASQLNAQNPEPFARFAENKSSQSTRMRNRQANSERRDNRAGENREKEFEERTLATSDTSSAVETAKASPAGGSIKVVMQIENGRVLKASIANHEPGRESFEALALRIARQRRYPVTKTGAEAVTITVNKPD
jgi:hypothetical protein